MKKVLLVLFILISLLSPVSITAAEITSDYDDDFVALFVIWSNSNYGITFDTDKDVLDSYIIDFLYDYIAQNYITLEQFNSLMEKIELYYNSEHVLKLDNKIQALFKACLDYMVVSSGINLILANTTYTITDTGQSDITEFIPSFQRIDPAYSRTTAVLSGSSNQYRWKFSFNNGVAFLDGWYDWELIDSLDYASFRIKISNTQSYTDSIFHINSLYATGSSSSQPNFPYELISFNMSDFDSDVSLKLDSYQKDGFYNINYIYKTFSTAEDRASYIAYLTDPDHFFNSVSSYTNLDRDRTLSFSGNQYILIIKRTTEIPFNYVYKECKTTDSYYRFMMFKNFTGTKSVLNSDNTCSDIEFTDYSSDLVSPLNFHDIEPQLIIANHSVYNSVSIKFTIGTLPSNISQNGNYYQIPQNLNYSSLSELTSSVSLNDTYSVKYYGNYTDTELDLNDSAAIQNESNLALNDSLNGNMSQKEINESSQYHSGLTDIFSQYIKPIDEFSSGLNLNKFDLPFAFKDAAQHSSEAVNNFFNLDFFQENSWVIPLLIAGLVLSILLR